jgi:hypothetical protein
MPRTPGWSRPDADDKRGQVSWLCGSVAGPFLKKGGLAAYSCGHSAGFSPASHFHPRFKVPMKVVLSWEPLPGHLRWPQRYCTAAWLVNRKPGGYSAP